MTSRPHPERRRRVRRAGRRLQSDGHQGHALFRSSIRSPHSRPTQDAGRALPEHVIGVRRRSARGHGRRITTIICTERPSNDRRLRGHLLLSCALLNRRDHAHHRCLLFSAGPRSQPLDHYRSGYLMEVGDALCRGKDRAGIAFMALASTTLAQDPDSTVLARRTRHLLRQGDSTFRCGVPTRNGR